MYADAAARDALMLASFAAVESVQCNRRLFAALYIVWRYPETLTARGIDDPRRLFASQELGDIRHLIEEGTKKK